MYLGRAAGPLKRLIDQYAQNLVLRLARHVGNFIDEQRAAVRLLQRARLARLLAVGLLDAKQFFFHPLRRDGGRVDDDKRPLRTCRSIVQRACGQLLAGSRRADNHDTAVSLGRAFNRLTQLIHACGAPRQRR